MAATASSPQNTPEVHWSYLLTHEKLRYSTVEHYYSLFQPRTLSELLNSDVLNQTSTGLPYAQLKDFEIGKRLHKGKGRSVYLARVKHDDQMIVAMKQMDYKTFRNRYCFDDEIQTSLTVQHSNIVTTFDCFYDHRYIYLLTAYVLDGDLSCYFDDNLGCDERLALNIIRDVALGLQQCHRQNIIFGDIKLENILITPGGCQLVDFGCAVVVKPGETYTRLRGTLEYIAPEVISGESYDYAIDVWSLGVLLYEMIYGSTPFNDENLSNIKNKIVCGTLNFDEDVEVSDDVILFIKGMLERDPKRRLTIDEVVEHPLLQRSEELSVLGRVKEYYEEKSSEYARIAEWQELQRKHQQITKE